LAVLTRPSARPSAGHLPERPQERPTLQDRKPARELEKSSTFVRVSTDEGVARSRDDQWVGISVYNLDLDVSVTIREAPGHQLQVNVDRRSIVTALADFFVNDCDCSKHDSEIRIAKIGNRFWGWHYAIREKYEGEDKWRGCDAVRNLLRRARRS
jgi:hypothetical protein